MKSVGFNEQTGSGLHGNIPPKPSLNTSDQSAISSRRTSLGWPSIEIIDLTQSFTSVTATSSAYKATEHQATTSTEQTGGDRNTNHSSDPDLDSCVYDTLVCSACKDWMIPGQDIFCACKVVCISCAAPLIKCEDCHHSFKQDIRLTNFRQRLAQQINRPCKYKHAGCPQVLKPGDDKHEHESNCDYSPVRCTKCERCVSKAHMKEHFDTQHFLTEKNFNVKLTDFYVNEFTNQRQIRCKAYRQYLYFTIAKLETREDFQFFVNKQCNEKNVTVRLDFIKDGYTYSRTTTRMARTNLNDMHEISAIDIDKHKFYDWANDECKLNIDVTVRKKHVPKREINKKLKIQKKKTIQQKQKKARLLNFK